MVTTFDLTGEIGTQTQTAVPPPRTEPTLPTLDCNVDNGKAHLIVRMKDGSAEQPLSSLHGPINPTTDPGNRDPHAFLPLLASFLPLGSHPILDLSSKHSQLKPATPTSPTATAQPPANAPDGRRPNKISIRAVAEESRARAASTRSGEGAATARNSSSRRRSTKLWGTTADEGTHTRENNSLDPPPAPFEWVRDE